VDEAARFVAGALTKRAASSTELVGKGWVHGTSAMRMLAAIANYGPFRFGCLDRMIESLQKMSCHVDIVIHSDRPKEVPDGVTLVVGLPTEDPCSLPFAHKQLFAERQDQYDLFLYSEDDILIREENVAAFLEATEILPDDEIAGLFRYELDVEGNRHYPDAHAPFDWVPGSVRTWGRYTFATFSNYHSGCYLLTRPQLARAVRSGGYLVQTRVTWIDLQVTAATDPYRQCGMTRRLCISHLERFLVHHIPNNYVGVLGTPHAAFQEQIRGLLRSART
jgi:hypothetical protein